MRSRALRSPSASTGVEPPNGRIAVGTCTLTSRSTAPSRWAIAPAVGRACSLNAEPSSGTRIDRIMRPPACSSASHRRTRGAARVVARGVTGAGPRVRGRAETRRAEPGSCNAQRIRTSSSDYSRNACTCDGSMISILALALGAAYAWVPAPGDRPVEPDLSPGVSWELARHRAGTISDLRYDLRLSIPEQRTEPIQGR